MLEKNAQTQLAFKTILNKSKKSKNLTTARTFVFGGLHVPRPAPQKRLSTTQNDNPEAFLNGGRKFRFVQLEFFPSRQSFKLIDNQVVVSLLPTSQGIRFRFTKAKGEDASVTERKTVSINPWIKQWITQNIPSISQRDNAEVDRAQDQSIHLPRVNWLLLITQVGSLSQHPSGSPGPQLV